MLMNLFESEFKTIQTETSGPTRSSSCFPDEGALIPDELKTFGGLSLSDMWMQDPNTGLLE